MERVTLDVTKREKNGKGAARSLRREGIAPAVLYRGGSAMSVQLSGKSLSHFINKSAGEQVIVNLKFPEETRQAIIKDFQVDPVNKKLLHVDFQEILATEMLKVMVHVVITGEAIGVKRDKGLLQHGLREIEIECLPDKIPGHINVDVSHLTIGRSIHVSDLKLEDGVRILTDPHEVIASVISIKEEVIAPVEAVAAVAEPEVAKKGKKPEEEKKK